MQDEKTFNYREFLLYLNEHLFDEQSHNDINMVDAQLFLLESSSEQKKRNQMKEDFLNYFREKNIFDFEK